MDKKSKIIGNKILSFNIDDKIYKSFIINLIKFIFIIILIYNFDYSFFFNNNEISIKYKNIMQNDSNFKYHKFERNIIKNKMIKEAHWQLTMNQAYFINGLIRKKKPKKCLEIGVADGGSSVLILNALKDINNSFLISLDLNTQSCTDKSKKTGNRVQTYFPELINKWQLYTGDLPHKFLDKLNLKFDFVFIDSAHETPGEILNLIEILPFLEENAIIVVHDILWHFTRRKPSPPKEIKFTPSSIFLISSLYGEKIIIKNNLQESGIENIGAVFLYDNQEKHYIDYFLLLNCFWEYMPTSQQINDLRIFIKKYYKNEIFLKLFEYSVKYNEIYINKFHLFVNQCLKNNTN